MIDSMDELWGGLLKESKPYNSSSLLFHALLCTVVLKPDGNRMIPWGEGGGEEGGGGGRWGWIVMPNLNLMFGWVLTIILG